MMTSDKQWQQLQEKLGVRFVDVSLLVAACTHRSYVNESGKRKLEHNERLEFLGDAVLSIVVRHYLYATFHETEGKMTEWCSELVCNRTLADVAKFFGLLPYLQVGRGEAQNSTHAKERQLANLFEALVGAIYIDRGLEIAARFVLQHILPKLDEVMAGDVSIDPISRLQQVVQGRYGVSPTYKMIYCKGSDHEKIYTVGVFVGEDMLAKANGWSNKIARRAAAEQALEGSFGDVPQSLRDEGDDESYTSSIRIVDLQTGDSTVARMIKAAIFLEKSPTFKALDISSQRKMVSELSREKLPR